MNDPAGYRAALESAALLDFAGHGVLKAEGDDAATFLHNLSTNEVKKLPPWHGCEAFFCTATAKAVGQAWIWREPPRGAKGKEEHLWIDTPAGLHAALFAHLKRYIVGEDVELADRTGEFPRFYLAGPQAAALLGAGGEPLTFAHAEGLTIRRRDLLGVPGFDVLGERAEELRQRLSLAEASPEAFEALRIEAGLPWWGKDVTPETFVPETGRLLQAICYTKGCYLGQEPVVMARDRGVVQRGLAGFLTGDAVVLPGLLRNKEGKEVGRVTSAAWSPRLGQGVALGYAKRGSQAPGTVLDLEGRPVTVTALPLVT